MARIRLPGWAQTPAYLAIRAFLGSATMGPLGPTVAGARALGRRYATLNRKRLNRAIDNLAYAFPDWDEAKRRRHAILAYEHLFALAVETSLSPRLLTDDAWPARVQIGASLGTTVQKLLDPGPAIQITAHCGNWELLGYTLSLIGFQVHALYRPLDLEPLDKWARETRQRRGLVLIDKFGAAERLPALMAGNKPVAFVADQNAGDRGLFVPFFGRLASSYKTIGLLAIQHEAPIVCGHARRLDQRQDDASLTSFGFDRFDGDPFRYRLDAPDVISPEDWVDQPDPLFYITARYRRAIEAMVRAAPEQYLWMHRYWKSRPRHEKLGRAFPASLRAKLEALPWMTPDELARIEEQSARDAASLANPKAPKPVQTGKASGGGGASDGGGGSDQAPATGAAAGA